MLNGKVQRGVNDFAVLEDVSWCLCSEMGVKLNLAFDLDSVEGVDSAVESLPVALTVRCSVDLSLNGQLGSLDFWQHQARN